jgi:hypothetical protein
MAVYLGSAGLIELTRVGEGSLLTTLDPSEVNPIMRRFSFDNPHPHGTFVTGDKLALSRREADGSLSNAPLDFIDGSGWASGNQAVDGRWYVHVDSADGIRLYKTWSDALVGDPDRAVALHQPAAAYKVQAELEPGPGHCLGQIMEYSISTERAAIDVTALGDAFAQSTSGLISGSGDIRCIWDWLPSGCGVGNEVEVAQYLHELILRQQLGSAFKANLYIKSSGAAPEGEPLANVPTLATLYYEVTGLITNVGIAFTAGEVVESKIEFVMTGPISMRYQLPALQRRYELENDGGFILTEAAGYLAQEARG